MLSWSLLLVPTALFGWRGYRHGFLEAVSRATGLLGGYITALLFTLPVGRWIELHTDLPGLLPFMLASAIFLFGVSIVISLLFDLINHLWPHHLRSSQLASQGGALFGAGVGACIGILLIWAASLIVGFTQGRIQTTSSLSYTLDKTAQQIAGRTIHLTLSRFDPPPAVSTASAAFLQAPQDTVARLQRISQRHNVKALLQQPDFQRVLHSGDLHKLQRQPQFRALIRDKDLRHLLTITGSEAHHEQRLAQALFDIWQRLQRLQSNQEYQALIRNKDFRQQLYSGNPLILVSSPELQRFTELILDINQSPQASLPRQPHSLH